MSAVMESAAGFAAGEQKVIKGQGDDIFLQLNSTLVQYLYVGLLRPSRICTECSHAPTVLLARFSPDASAMQHSFLAVDALHARFNALHSAAYSGLSACHVNELETYFVQRRRECGGAGRSAGKEGILRQRACGRVGGEPQYGMEGGSD